MKVKSVKNVFKTIVLNIVLFSFLSCSNPKTHNNEVAMEPVAINETFEAVEKQQTKNNEIVKNLKIIKSANVKYKVKNVKNATKQIKKIAQQYNAYISDLRFQNNLYEIQNRFTVKVPQKTFDIVLDSIAAVATFIEYENISTEDVSEEFIDLETRLKTKTEVKNRYEAILRKNAKTVKEILATEDKLRIIQEEIESAKGKLNYLTNKVAYSTIQIDLYEEVNYKEKPETYYKTFWEKSKDGFSFGWECLEYIFLSIFYIWPIVIIGSILYFFIKKRFHKK